MFSESELLPISALQHLLFCPRQCALIHIERLWAEDRRTVEGRRLHDRAHGKDRGPRGGGLQQLRDGVRSVRALPLRSLRLGLAGVADVVEFPDAGPPQPVEFKRGRPKKSNMDRVQLCAQAMCLEEMLGVTIPQGALFYGRLRRRELVPLGPGLRAATERAAAQLRALILGGRSPPAVFERKCRSCSLRHLCLPEATTGTHSATRYIARALAAQRADLDVPPPDGAEDRP